MIANYHTHTSRCGHGGNFRDEDYVLAAMDNGIAVLGFSDHTPWPYETGFDNSRVRMDITRLPEYTASIRELQEKYKGKIRIYLGMECEYFPKYLPWLQSRKKEMDYLILGNHWHLNNENGELYFGRSSQPEDIINYVKCTVEGLETGMFTYLAHPDLVFARYPSFDETAEAYSHVLCREAKRLNIPLEFNILGLQRWDIGEYTQMGYPHPKFWEIAAEEGCAAIIGLDAHIPEHFYQKERVDRAVQRLQSLGICVLQTVPGLE